MPIDQSDAVETAKEEKSDEFDEPNPSVELSDIIVSHNGKEKGNNDGHGCLSQRQAQKKKFAEDQRNISLHVPEENNGKGYHLDINPHYIPICNILT